MKVLVCVRRGHYIPDGQWTVEAMMENESDAITEAPAAQPAPPPPPVAVPARTVPVATAQRGPGMPVSMVGKTRNPWGVFLLSLVTLGIYQAYWYYSVNREVRDYDHRIAVQPGIALLALLFGSVLVLPPFISLAKTGSRICKAQQIAGSNNRCSGLIGLLLFIVGFGAVYYQSQLNKVWDVYGNPEPNTPVAA